MVVSTEESSMAMEDPKKGSPSEEQSNPSAGKEDSPELPDDDLKAVTGGLQPTPGPRLPVPDVCITEL
jgi:hypothetical protein